MTSEQNIRYYCQKYWIKKHRSLKPSVFDKAKPVLISLFLWEPKRPIVWAKFSTSTTGNPILCVTKVKIDYKNFCGSSLIIIIIIKWLNWSSLLYQTRNIVHWQHVLQWLLLLCQMHHFNRCCFTMRNTWISNHIFWPFLFFDSMTIP